MNKKERLIKLNNLKAICREAIKEFFKKYTYYRDLDCRDVHYCLSADGNDYYLFSVEGCPPDEQVIISFIADHILDEVKEGTHIQIETEW